MFDLNLISLHLEQGHEIHALPGFYVAPIPRHVARGRSGDQLFFLVTLQNFPGFSPSEMHSLFDRLGQVFYQIPGTVTSALRDTAEVLNQELLNRNLKAGKTGTQGVALLNLAAIHNHQLYLAHCGPTHSFLVSSKIFEHFTDQQTTGRGLGLSRTVNIRFYQANLEAGASLIFCAEPPLIWTDSLLTSSLSLSQDALKRRLISQVHPNFSAVVIQFQEGNGKTSLNGKPWVTAPIASSQPKHEEPTTAKPISEPPRTSAAKPIADEIAAKATEQPTNQKIPQTTPSPAPTQAVISKPTHTTPPQKESASNIASHSTERPAPNTTSHAKQEGPRHKTGASFWKGFSPIWQEFRQAWNQFGQSTHEFFNRLLPVRDDKENRLSPGMMIIIAIAIPVLVSALGLGIYFQKGQNAQYQTYYEQADAIAQQAGSESNTKMARNDWASILILLDKADSYRVTTESSALRQKAQDAIDHYDGVTRLSYQVALADRLSNNVKITKILTNSNDLYLLDATSGSVIRATLTSSGYKVDTNFQCAPGSYGSLSISSFVDMLVMPINNAYDASIAAIDKSGDILFCIPNKDPQPNSSALLPPATHWGSIIDMTLLENQLYVLDTSSNIGVYSITQNEQGQITGIDSKVTEFFSEVPKLGDVLDMAIDTQDLYLLHNDGHLTHCTYSAAGVQATACTDPANYSDSRSAYEPSVTNFPGIRFIQIQYTEPPFPSIGILDASTNDIYQFSLRINLQRLLRPQASLTTLEGSATAFYISSQQTVFLAFGNQVYYSNLP